MTIKGTDKVSEFPEHFNALEAEVKKLAENTRGIKSATWITAGATVVLAVVAVLTLIITFCLKSI